MKVWMLQTGFLALIALVVATAYALFAVRTRRRPRDASSNEEDRIRLQNAVLRFLAIGCTIQGAFYIAWRYGWSLNPRALWFAIPLAAAETYAFIDSLLFAIMMWRPTQRSSLPPLEGATVDVFITTYNEPMDIVRLTAEAAARIDWPDLRVWVLDDGARPEMKSVAESAGCGYISRGPEWADKPRHAKAGNVNNALLETTGDFILILDADQIPDPRIVGRIIGYFRDPRLAFVQTPQSFYNIPPGDPFASDAPLFYGPILRGKDGWNAAFFCGSNALLRREALIQLGLAEYAREMRSRLSRGLRRMQSQVSRIRPPSPAARDAVKGLRRAIASSQRSLEKGVALESVSRAVQEAILSAQAAVARADMQDIAESLGSLSSAGVQAAGEARASILESVMADLTPVLPSDPGSLGITARALDDLSLTRPDEAIPVLPLATISITEDMATAMRLHAQGWRSAFHSEILAQGLAPEDLGSALGQRLRWAQGTIQVLLRENPLFKKGLSIGQRIQYFTTMFSYFSGFSSLIFLLSPIVFGLSGVGPLVSWNTVFFWLFIPYFLLNQAMYRFVSLGTNVRRGEQYSLALFPLWIRAILDVITGRKLKFVVTPKERMKGTYRRLVVPQIAIVGLTVVAMAYCLLSFVLGWNRQPIGLAVNMGWGIFNILSLSAIIRAAVYRPPKGWKPEPPAFRPPSTP